MAAVENNILKSWLRKNCRWGKFVRTQVGVFWAGQLQGSIYLKDGMRYGLIKNIRATPMGFKGLSDYVGYRTITITPEMVGNRIAVAVCLEGKSPKGVVSAEQAHFLKVAREDGCITMIVRSADQEPPKFHEPEKTDLSQQNPV